MKSVAASSVGQYERSVLSLADYYRAVELGLGACFRQGGPDDLPLLREGLQKPSGGVVAVVFGSDQGLVGQFNDVVADDARAALAKLPGEVHVWAVGERVHSRLAESGFLPEKLFTVPSSVTAISQLVGTILVEVETRQRKGGLAQLSLFYNRHATREVYTPTTQRLLPLDEDWRHRWVQRPWPTKTLPEVMGGNVATLPALLSEYLFISLFRACAESLASENASRLAAMERADKNIDDLLEELHDTFNRLRQSSIDEELFDVVSGFEALSKDSGRSSRSS